MPLVPGIDYDQGLPEVPPGCPVSLERWGYDGEPEPIPCELKPGHDGPHMADAEMPVAIGFVVGYEATVTLRWEVKD